jgi:hypothetical protein
MLRSVLQISVIAFFCAALSVRAGNGGPGSKAADPRFEALLAAAQKDAAKADWNALRHAFAETSFYEPYSGSWRTDLAKVRKEMQAGKLKAAETALVKLLERERFMRLDGHATAVALYEKLGDSVKAGKHRAFLEGLGSAVFVAGRGQSIEAPIEVLFIEEEYDFLAGRGLTMKKQALTERDGHRFDVITTDAMAGEPQREFYFNIDMPWRSLQASLTKALERSKESAAKK